MTPGDHVWATGYLRWPGAVPATDDQHRRGTHDKLSLTVPT